jgi:hypothetical protein
MAICKRVLISEPGFSNFGIHFKEQSSERIFLHRNFDLNSSTFRLFRVLRLITLLEWLNTHTLILKFRFNKCDKLIIIKGCTVNIENKLLKEIGYTVYLWDSIKNVYRGERFLNIPQNVMTFDLNDSINYGFIYLPLFHFRGKGVLTNEHINWGAFERNTISLYGSFSLDRLNVIDQIINDVKCVFSIKYFLTITKIQFLKEVITDPKIAKRLWKYTTFKKLYRSNIDEMLKCSLFTFDIANKNQTGMTTRTFEALSFSTKLITNNITTVNFCNSLNIPVLYFDFDNKLQLKDHLEFILKEYTIEQSFIDEYSISNFLNKIIKHDFRI